jgi:hypothetical protein
VEGWLEGSDAVARQEESVEAWEVGEVCKRGDVVVGEVDCIVVLVRSRSSVLNPSQVYESRARAHASRWAVRDRGVNGHTFATPKFSIAGILWPLFHLL